jgi:uroporphyrinogen decarboxylase
MEAVVDYAIMSQFLGQKVTGTDLASQVEFWRKAGYDYIPLTVGMMQPGRVTQESEISKVIRDVMLKDTADGDGGQAWNLARRSWLHTEEDFEAFPWEEVARLDLTKFHEVQPHLSEGMKVIALSGKIFTLTWMLMGFENFALTLKLNPTFVSRVFERVAQIQLKALRSVVGLPNVAAAWAVDDLAFGFGPMIHPQGFRDFVFPWYKEFGRICHENGLYFFFHTDGQIWELLEDVIAMGVDALHPIDPTCMDIEEVKDKVGDRLCIVGNISNELLMTGTPDEVTELTKRRLRVLAPGGGYCLGSGNSVPDWARFENYRAMIDTGLKYGQYPIDIT